MARQLGLRVGRIVIDAGHGGRDPGASGPGFTESALTLDIALRLEKLLTKEPGLEVVLTRRTDEYVGLQERTAIANREGADLFLSIHANASRNRNARGVESYLLNFASTPEAAAVAARENASSTLTMSHLNDLVKQIALNNKLDESRDLARHVQTTLVQKLRPSNQGLKDLGVKQAPFVVLVGASMPSILVEVSFLSHRQEGRLLSTGTFRQRIADALFDGLRGYLRTLKRAETDAPEPGPEPGQGQADDPSAGRLQ
jgi:N-acetylmuramoyl-L-alanine amidase